MKKIYKFRWDVGRMGHLDSIFTADDEDVKKAIGQQVYFGEVLGKHSEIYGPLEEKDIKVLTDDQDFIKKAEEIGLDHSGYNPLHYLPEEEEEEER